MYIEELRRLFCEKISNEIKQYRQRTLRLSPEEIFSKSYQTDCMINIYEALAEMSEKAGCETLKALIVVPGLLSFMYSSWIKFEDSSAGELRICIEEEMARILRQKMHMRGICCREKEGAAS